MNKAPRATFYQFLWSYYIHRKSLKCLAASRDNPSLSRAITTHSKQRERNVVLVEAAVGGGGSALRDEPKRRLRRRLPLVRIFRFSPSPLELQAGFANTRNLVYFTPNYFKRLHFCFSGSHYDSRNYGMKI